MTDDFWTAREELAHIHTFAHARLTAPYAVLGGVLRHAIVSTEPGVQLPPTVCTYASVNLFVALVGAPGFGKDGSNGTAADAVHFVDTNKVHIGHHIGAAGSGEGLARQFLGHKGDEPRTRVDITVPEIGTLQALAGRTGATLGSELLKAYMGQPLGFSNNNKDTSTFLPAQSYRLTMSIGVQPDNAGFFIDEAKSGFPQRFLWLPTRDCSMPWPPPTAPKPITVMIPRALQSMSLREVNMPEWVREYIRRLQHTKHVDDSADPLAGHRGLTQLKTAFGLAVLAGRAAIDDEDWQLSGHLMNVSDETRDDLWHRARQNRRRANRQRAIDRAEADGISEERKAELDRDKTEKAVWRFMGDRQPHSGRDITRALPRQLRHLVPDEISAKVKSGAFLQLPPNDNRGGPIYQRK